MDPDVAEKIIIKNAYQPKIMPPKIVKLEATGKEKETLIEKLRSIKKLVLSIFYKVSF